MKNLVVALVMVGMLSLPVFAAPTINFSEGSGSWDYIAAGPNAGMIQINPVINIDKGLGNTTDTLVGKEVVLPNLTVSYVGGNYILTPVSNTVVFKDATTTYFTGVLGNGIWDLQAGSASTAYPNIKADIYITSVNNTIGSAALSEFAQAWQNDTPVDMVLSLDIAGVDILSQVTSGANINGGSISGSMAVVPAPGAILLGSLGTGLVGWLRRRRAL